MTVHCKSPRYNPLRITSMALAIQSSTKVWSIKRDDLPRNRLRALPCTQNTKHVVVNCLSSKQALQPHITRQSANYKPTIWNYDFVQSLKSDPIVCIFFFFFIKLNIFV